MPWLSQNNQDPYADDYDKYTPWQRNEEKIKTLQAVAKIVAEAIFSVHSSLDLLREVFKLILLLPKQKPLSHLSQDWTETFDDDQSNRHKTSDRARQKHVQNVYHDASNLGYVHIKPIPSIQMTYWSAGGLGMFDVARRCSQIIEFFSDYLFIEIVRHILLATTTSQDHRIAIQEILWKQLYIL